MDKAEAKRRARIMAAGVIESALDGGWELNGYTADGSEADEIALAVALRELAGELVARLPAGYRPRWWRDVTGVDGPDDTDRPARRVTW